MKRHKTDEFEFNWDASDGGTLEDRASSFARYLHFRFQTG